MKKNKILIIAAHPDDEVLGCGGTVARFVQNGYDAYTLILGEGITARDEQRNRSRRAKEIRELKAEIPKANRIMGVKKIYSHDFPDNRFDSVSLLDVIKVVERTKNEVNPQIIFTHYRKDLNVDHQITYRAVMTATRPLPQESVKEIYSFEILSSTEWNYPSTFQPDIFFDIEDTLSRKLRAVREYRTELRDFPHPRSIEGIQMNAKHWGMKVGLKYAEAFKIVRIIR